MQDNSKLLFVGDLTTAGNYGAIATSEALKQLAEQRFSSIRYIDYRSLINPTPLQGWGEVSPTRQTVLRTIIEAAKWPVSLAHRAFPLFTASLWKKLFNASADLGRRDIPFLFSQYDKFAEDVLKGNTLQYERDLIEWSDIVLINAEGNFVHGTDKYGKYRTGALYLLFLAYVSIKYFGRHCVIINHTVDPDNQDAAEIIKNVYPLLDYITVRESFSAEKLRSWGINRAKLVPDALFTFFPETSWKPSENLKNEIDFSRPYLCLGDSSGVRSRTNQVKWDVFSVYNELIEKLRKIVPQIVFVDGFNGGYDTINNIIKHNGLGRVNLSNCSYQDLHEVLKRGEIFISGRYHASILSAMGGTPILLWGADSYKTEGLYRLLDYPYRFFEIDTIPVHIDDISTEVRKVLENQEDIRRDLLRKTELLRDAARDHLQFNID